MNTTSDTRNPYEPPTHISRGHRSRLRRWFANLWTMAGAVAGLILLAILTTGPKATLAMTVKNPISTISFFATFSFATLLVFTAWKSVRSLILPVLDAGPFLRAGCGFLAIFMYLPGVWVLRQSGILNMNEYSQAYNWFVIVAHGLLSIAIPVEIEQYLALRRKPRL